MTIQQARHAILSRVSKLHWKRLSLELVLEGLMVLAPTSLDLLAAMGEYVLEHNQFATHQTVAQTATVEQAPTASLAFG